MIWNRIRHPDLFSAGLALLLAVVCPVAVRADRIILRSLKIISDRTVVSFDDDGVVLDNQQRLAWHDIEKATIAPDKQAAFDKLLTDLGGPIYRVRQRLSTADFEGLLQPAETLYPRFVTQSTDTAYVIVQSVMWGRIAAGRREEAVEPYLRCFEILRTRKSAANALPGQRRLQFDLETGLTPDLTPVWFNAASAKNALPGVFRRIAEMQKPRPEGASIYYATLAIAAGDHAAADKVLSAMKSDQPGIAELRVIIDAQREVVTGKPGIALAKLGISTSQMKPENQPLAWYWLGLGKLRDSSSDAKKAGMLQLLRIPALAGRQHPELAGAALFHVMETLAAQGSASESVAVRRELLERYGQTYYALQVRGATKTATEKKL
jgi:hypothetical protein